MHRRFLFWTPVAFLVLLAGAGSSFAATFPVDEVLAAVKKEIQSAQGSQAEEPRFNIEKVALTLWIFSEEAKSGQIELKIAGLSYEEPNRPVSENSYHRIYLSFYPNAVTPSPLETTSGLVEVINRAKASLKAAYLSPPAVVLETYTVDISFGVMRHKNGGIRFLTTDIARLKSLRVPIHLLKIQMAIEAGGGR